MSPFFYNEEAGANPVPSLVQLYRGGGWERQRNRQAGKLK